MHKLALVLLMLWAAIGFAQQWQVVESVELTGQTQPISPTILLTPSEPATYRLLFYFSGGGGVVVNGYYDLSYAGQDISGAVFHNDLVAPCGKLEFTSTSLPVSLMPNQPLMYQVGAVGPSLGCTYNLTITVEQLVQSNH